MSDTDLPDHPEGDNFESYYALLAAFQTMKERCQQLQARLATVEEENVCLRLECGKDMSTAIVKMNDNDEKTVVQALQIKVEELTKQRSQLTHHIFMVAAENRKLWNRLTKLTRTNKCLGNQLTKISDTLKQHSQAQPSDIMSYNFRDASNSGEKEQSLEEISLRLINSIMLEKSDLEQQYTEMVELQNSTQLNLQNVGFTYPEDSDNDSLDQLKQHDTGLLQIKDALLVQQTKLKRVVQNLKNVKEGITCNNCRLNARKKLCQTGTQFDTDGSFKHDTTQTSLSSANISIEKLPPTVDSPEPIIQICPMCGISFGKLLPFTEFHEHVLNHFGEDIEEYKALH